MRTIRIIYTPYSCIQDDDICLHWTVFLLIKRNMIVLIVAAVAAIIAATHAWTAKAD